ncbi:X8 domain [Musa troglodytarum]|uniref:X8 domain n=1 Tax=Musa troglodytarum TaxID=320322 RepID=A0A9E7F4B8_9LILI|nr:X8 domain [Musa troglodytarum]
MASAFVLLTLILTFFGGSDAGWCVCRSDVSTSALQKSLDYACGAGADCTPVLQNGACYNPNTVLAHCSYAVNSYYQRKGQPQGSCDFAATATLTSTDPGGNGCTYPATPRYFPLSLCKTLLFSFHPSQGNSDLCPFQLPEASPPILFLFHSFALHQCCRNFKHPNRHKQHSNKRKYHNSYNLHPKHRDNREHWRCAGRPRPIRHNQQFGWEPRSSASKDRTVLFPLSSLAVLLDSAEYVSPHI